MDLEFIRAIARRQRQLGIGLVEITAGEERVCIAFGSQPAQVLNPVATPAPADPSARIVRAQALGLLECVAHVDDTVSAGQVLAVLVLGERRVDVLAPCAGRITAQRVEEGARVDYGMPLFELNASEDCACRPN